MYFFQLQPLPGCRWPPVPDSPSSQVWIAYLHLDRSQWLPAAELQQLQFQQLRELLAHCQAHVPYYRQLFATAGITADSVRSMDDLRRIPVLPRRTYQERHDGFLAEQLPAGTVATGDMVTSGSSGTPTRVFQTNVVNLWWLAFYLRDLEWCAVDPTGSIAVIRSVPRTPETLAGKSFPVWQPALQTLIKTGPAHVMSIHQDHQRQLEWLRQVNPEYLLSYPSNLDVLAGLLRGERAFPRLRAIQAISDTLTDEARARIETGFGVPVKNTYTCAEAGYLASPCPAGQGLHVHAENVILEVLDDAGQPCAAHEAGRVFLTTLHNFRAPLVRYELGDEVTLGADRCPCGRGLPLLAAVQGKNSPMFHLAGGRQKSSVTAALLLRKLGGHWQHQLIQKAVDHVVVRLAVNPEWTAAHAALLTQQFQEFFEAPIRIDLEIHHRLPLPASGKFQNMVVEWQPEAHPSSRRSAK